MPRVNESGVPIRTEARHRFSVACENSYIDVTISSQDGEYEIDFTSTRRDPSGRTEYQCAKSFNCEELLALANCATKAWEWIQDDLR